MILTADWSLVRLPAVLGSLDKAIRTSKSESCAFVPRRKTRVEKRGTYITLRRQEATGFPKKLQDFRIKRSGVPIAQLRHDSPAIQEHLLASLGQFHGSRHTI